jgi:hypothetical protein
MGTAIEKAAARLGLALGDAAIAAEMEILYPDAREPWVRARGPRGSGPQGVVAEPVEVEPSAADDDATTARFLILDADAPEPAKEHGPE